MVLAARNTERTNRHFDRAVELRNHLHSIRLIIVTHATDSRIAKTDLHRELCESIKKRRTAHLILRPSKSKSTNQLVRRGF